MPKSDYPILKAEIVRARKHFLAPSDDKQTLLHRVLKSILLLY